mmetsp:Transcript_63345/g.145076  ORF Transcript_63345/g.145076 Transcript_63345/m.145076 type:complete len:208 (+) Transcript_63345:430-1053(+)
MNPWLPTPTWTRRISKPKRSKTHSKNIGFSCDGFVIATRTYADVVLPLPPFASPSSSSSSSSSYSSSMSSGSTTSLEERRAMVSSLYLRSNITIPFRCSWPSVRWVVSTLTHPAGRMSSISSLFISGSCPSIADFTAARSILELPCGDTFTTTSCFFFAKPRTFPCAPHAPSRRAARGNAEAPAVAWTRAASAAAGRTRELALRMLI